MVALLSPLLPGCMYLERGPASGSFDRQPTSRQTLTLLLLVRSPSAWYGARMTFISHLRTQLCRYCGTSVYEL